MFGLLHFLSFSSFLKLFIKVKAANPVATAPVTFSTELRAPPTECAIKEVVP